MAKTTQTNNTASLQVKYDILVHALWHALDNAEERVTEHEVVLTREDFATLSALIPEEHPDVTVHG